MAGGSAEGSSAYVDCSTCQRVHVKPECWACIRCGGSVPPGAECSCPGLPQVTNIVNVHQRQWINVAGTRLATDSVAAFEPVQYQNETRVWLTGGQKLELRVSADEFQKMIEQADRA